MTTKAQERQAIVKIRRIVEELGENSYVGTAMDGVLEVAEQNIADDAAYSMKERMEIAERRKQEQAENLEKLKKELEAARTELAQSKEWWKEQQADLKKQLQEAQTLVERYKMPKDMYESIWLLIDEVRKQEEVRMMCAAEAVIECIGESNISSDIRRKAQEFKECRKKLAECEDAQRELDRRYEKKR